MTLAEKVILLGLDGSDPVLLKKLVKAEKLPNIKKLMVRGVFSKAISVFPPVTPPNWASIVTGAYPNTHGISGYYLHFPGERPGKKVDAFNSFYCQTEFLWDAAERAGKKSIILRFPLAWPPTIKEGIVLDGFAAPSPDISPFEIVPARLFVHGKLTPRDIENLTREDYMAPENLKEFAPQIEIKKVKGWNNLPFSNSEILEAILPLRSKDDKICKNIYILIIDSSGRGYDKIYICRDKDADNLIGVLGKGDWSEWSLEEFSELGKGGVRFKLVELTPDASNVKICCDQVMIIEGLSYPKKIGKELVKKFGPYISLDTPFWVGLDAAMEIAEYQVKWLGKASKYLTSTYDWNILFTHFHGIDNIMHAVLPYLLPIASKYNPELFPPEKEYIYLERMYQLADKLVGEYLNSVDEKTAIVIVSDHGEVPTRLRDHEVFSIMCKTFAERGLIKYRQDKEVDWDKSKVFFCAIPHIWINLKGREPEGIVEPGEEYEEVRDEIITALHSLKHGQRNMVTIAARREEATSLGVGGELTGDIYVAYAAGYGGEHASLTPTTVDHGYSNYATFLMAGPGIKKGIELENPVRLVDVTPTISHILGIPPPIGSEGAIIHKALE